MKLKKLFGVVLALFLLAIVIIISDSERKPMVSNKLETYTVMERSFVQLTPYELLDKRFLKNNMYKDSFAGIYLDGDGILNVNLVSNLEEIKQLVGSDKIKYHLVTNSFRKLEETDKILTDRMKKLAITGLRINTEKNKVTVYLKEMDEEKINNIKRLVDPNTVEFEKGILLYF